MADAGTDWNRLAGMPGITGVLDPRDPTGAKNRLIHEAHRLALAPYLDHLDGERVLDFGCGQGRMAEELVRRGARVDGVDAAAGMVAAATARVPQARFATIDPRQPRLEHDAYRLVLSVCVLQYVAPEADALGATVAELARALARGGRLVALERVDDGGAEIGAPVATYRAAIERAGLTPEAVAFARAQDARVLRLVQRFPALAGWRALHGLYARASNEVSPGHPRPGSYAEYLFVARRA